MDMDHVINAIMPYYDYELDMLARELNSGKCKNLTDCPSYRPARTLLEAIRIIERYQYGKPQSLSIRSEMRLRGLI